ncbi:M48 family metallopeptidase [archaeon]|nr:M48 family metallopeptidase [archaeon]
MEQRKQGKVFENIYTFFMFLFGFGIILAIFAILATVIYIDAFLLIYMIPLVIGVFNGVFKSSEKGPEVEPDKKSKEKLLRLTEELNEQLGIKKTLKIILTAGSEVGVSGLFRKKIVIGLVALKFLNEKELLAILAHEYGHFTNRDTIFGYLSYRIQHFFEVQRQVNRSALGPNFFIVFTLPTWIFFELVSRYYALISLWRSRNAEYNADAYAADFVGKQSYADTLTKYYIVADIFETTVPEYVLHYLEQDKIITNLYETIRPFFTEEKNIDFVVQRALHDKSGRWSTHPSLSERLEHLGIKKVEVSFTKVKDFLVNQKKYEENASKAITHSYVYWKQLVAMAEQEEQ